MEPVNALALGIALFVTGLFLGNAMKRRYPSGKVDFLIDLNIQNNQKLNNMPTKAEFQAAFAEVNDALNNIGDDITRLTGQLADGSLTEAEEADVLAELTALGARAKEIAGRTAEPETPEEPEVPEEPIEPPTEA